MPPPDPEPEDEDVKEERKQLNLLKLRSFTVSPPTIRPFEQATLKWEVSVPATAANVATFHLGGAVVPAVGSRAVGPLATGAFLLEARSASAKRILGTRVVQVDQTGLQEREISAKVIQDNAQDVKKLMVAGTLTSRGDVAVSMAPPDAVLVEVPLKASIPNFYDADIDVDLTIALAVVSEPGGRRVLRVTLRSVGVDVVFHLLEHIFSLGAATAAQSIIQPLAADLIKAFLGPQIEAQLRTVLDPVIAQMLSGMSATDEPKHRTFKLYAIETTPFDLVIIGAPAPAAGSPLVLNGGSKARSPAGRRRRARASRGPRVSGRKGRALPA